MSELAVSTESISTLSSEMSDGPYYAGSRTGTSITDEEEEDHFHHDAATSVYDGLKDAVTADVVGLELVSLRMTANASDNQVRRAVVAAFMKRIQQLIEAGKGAGEAVREIFGKYREVVERSLFDRGKTEKPDQVDLLLLIQQELVTQTKGETVLLFTAKELYELEIVEEEAYEQWWAHEDSYRTEDMRRVRSQTQQFVDWLANAEEEESSEEEDEEEEEEESEEEEEEE